MTNAPPCSIGSLFAGEGQRASNSCKFSLTEAFPAARMYCEQREIFATRDSIEFNIAREDGIFAERRRAYIFDRSHGAPVLIIPFHLLICDSLRGRRGVGKHDVPPCKKWRLCKGVRKSNVISPRMQIFLGSSWENALTRSALMSMVVCLNPAAESNYHTRRSAMLKN